MSFYIYTIFLSILPFLWDSDQCYEASVAVGSVFLQNLKNAGHYMFVGFFMLSHNPFFLRWSMAVQQFASLLQLLNIDFNEWEKQEITADHDGSILPLLTEEFMFLLATYWFSFFPPNILKNWVNNCYKVIEKINIKKLPLNPPHVWPSPYRPITNVLDVTSSFSSNPFFHKKNLICCLDCWSSWVSVPFTLTV